MSRKRITVPIAAAVLGLTLLTGAGCDGSKVEECARQGGTVEVEHSAKVEIKKGQRKAKTVKEYECVAPDGTELFEWK